MSADRVHRLIVELHDTLVGELTLRGNSVRFVPDDGYLHSSPRPVLGQAIEDDPAQRRVTHHRLSPWFSNLLPEKGGPLREMVARQFGIHPDREFLMIAKLGHDLPGAVTVRAVGEPEIADGEPDDAPAAGAPDGVRLKFSLAGVQLKLSMLRGRRGLTLPASGAGGDWIVKLPFHELGGVPENEFAMMTWLTRAGIDVPPIALVRAEDLHGVPEGLLRPGTRVFAIHRFDRGPDGRRHIEDFAQIFDVYPEEKYRHANYESIGRVLLALAGEDAVAEFVRRLVAVVLTGNGDAHLKNWSLRYAGAVDAELSPAYDFVSTIVYGPFRADTLALNLDRTKDFAAVTRATFRRFGERIGHSGPERLAELAGDFADRMVSVWPAVAADVPLPDEMRNAITARLRDLPLARGR